MMLLARIATATLLLPLALLTVPRDDGDDLAKQLPRIPATEPARALATFRLHAGFRLIPSATEPLVTDPVSAAFDADGRLYVVEMRGYPYPENVPTGRVRRLEDRDDDGVFDHGTTFLDGLSWPTSVLPHDGGVLVVVPPEILFARDDDGDGVADTRKVLFTGFGTSNVQALVNGLAWGSDGWVYGASGGNGGDITAPGRPELKPVSVRGRDFRFRPDGSAFEAISGGGQFGHTFDDWGHRFVSSNSNHIRQIVMESRYLERNPSLAAPAPIVDIAVEGGAGPVFRISEAEPWRLVRTRQRAADPEFVKRAPPSELVATGFFTSATGVTIYRGTAYPPEYCGNAFIGDVGGNLVHRKRLTTDGAIYRAERADAGVEFLASTDNWFRPVNFLNTPDGTLLILDMYRETIEHPWSIPEPIKQHLDLTSGHDRGRLFHLVPDGFQHRPGPRLAHASTADLVARLDDPDAWPRETAQRLLIERRDPASVPAIRALSRSARTPQGRLLALATLDALGVVTADDLTPALADAEPRVRERAARLYEPIAAADSVRVGPLARLADDPDAMVRFQAALSLGSVAGEEALAALAAIAARDGADRWTRTAIFTGLAGRVDRFATALARRGVIATAAGPGWLGELAELLGAENRAEATARFLHEFVAADTDPGVVRSILLGLGRGTRRSGGSLAKLLDSPAGSTLAPQFARAAEVAAADGAESPRVEAIALVGLGSSDRALALLPPLLEARQPAGVQLAALRALAEQPGPAVGPLIVQAWKSLTPALRREAAEALLARPDRVGALLDGVASGGVGRADLDPARLQALRQHADAAIRERAQALLGPEASGNRAAVVAAYRPALDLAGRTEAGKAVFQAQCATCHRADGLGHDVGPDLATVSGRSAEDLLGHILDPNREVAPTFQNYSVATDDGRVLTGVITAESATTLTLRRAEGVQDVIPRTRIEGIAASGQSLMPEGLEREIPAQAMADLLAYIRSIRPAAPAAAGSGR